MAQRREASADNIIGGHSVFTIDKAEHAQGESTTAPAASRFEDDLAVLYYVQIRTCKATNNCFTSSSEWQYIVRSGRTPSYSEVIASSAQRIKP